MDYQQGEPLRAFITRNGSRRTMTRHSRFHRAGKKLSHVLLLEDGWVARLRTDEDGMSAFMALHMAGDVVGADAFAEPVEDELVALTEIRVMELPLNVLRDQAAASPSLALSLASLLATETVFLREALFAVGRQPSDARLCTFFLQTFYRLVAAGLADPESRRFDLPLNQSELASAVGLTSVHVSRIIRVLRERGWLEFHGGRVHLLNIEAVQRHSQLTLWAH